MEIITSLQNKFIKMAASLQQKKHRDELELFIVEGVRLVEEAARSQWLIEACICTEESLAQKRVQDIVADLERKHCRVLQVAEGLYKKISDTKEPQGIMALVRKKTYSLDEIVSRERKDFFLILDEVQDPGNVGTMIRTAAATGCTGVILTKGCTDVFSTKAVRSSMGSIFQVPVVDGVEPSAILSAFAEHGIEILATSLESSTVYFDVNFNRSIGIVFGNEGNGVSAELLAESQERLYVPLVNQVESLNVAACAAVILYEVVRQRR